MPLLATQASNAAHRLLAQPILTHRPLCFLTPRAIYGPLTACFLFYTDPNLIIITRYEQTIKQI